MKETCRTIAVLLISAAGCTSQPSGAISDARAQSTQAAAKVSSDRSPDSSSAPDSPTARGGGAPARPAAGIRLVYDLDWDGARTERRGQCLGEVVRSLGVALGLQAESELVMARATLEALHARAEWSLVEGAADQLRLRLLKREDAKQLDPSFEARLKSCAALEHSRAEWIFQVRMPSTPEQRAQAASAVAAVVQRRLNELAVPASVEQVAASVALLCGGVDEGTFAKVRATVERRGKLEFRVVRDDEDFIGLALQRVPPPWPEGMGLDQVESVAVGDGPVRSVHFATLPPVAHETAVVARARLAAVLGTLPIPADRALLLSARTEYDEPTRSFVPNGWRTYYVQAWAELGNDGLRTASATAPSGSSDAQVALEFTEEGGRAFAALTADQVGRRMAIVLDDVVQTVPIVMQRIGGGRAIITMGSAEPARAAEQAAELALVLRTGALPYGLLLASEELVGR